MHRNSRGKGARSYRNPIKIDADNVEAARFVG
jgi:hypothetical protein